MKTTNQTIRIDRMETIDDLKIQEKPGKISYPYESYLKNKKTLDDSDIGKILLNLINRRRF
jgi:hypothetical protein